MVRQDAINRLNLTVVALVAIVAIIGLAALVMNSTEIVSVSTGSQFTYAAHQDSQVSIPSGSGEENLAGELRRVSKKKKV